MIAFYFSGYGIIPLVNFGVMTAVTLIFNMSGVWNKINMIFLPLTYVYVIVSFLKLFFSLSDVIAILSTGDPSWVNKLFEGTGALGFIPVLTTVSPLVIALLVKLLAGTVLGWVAAISTTGLSLS
jgi:hypothetical protein